MGMQGGEESVPFILAIASVRHLHAPRSKNKIETIEAIY